jgi:hypothetical protein
MFMQRIAFLLLVLAASLACTLTATAQQVSGKPQNQLDTSVHGSRAQLVNGALLFNALAALDSLEEKAPTSLQPTDIMLMGADGHIFQVVSGAKTNSYGMAASVDRDGKASVSSATQPVEAQVSMSLDKLRAIGAANQFFLAKQKMQSGASRDIKNYDILVYPKDGSHYVVAFLHHRPQGIATWSGCYDGSGYNAQYLVDSLTHSVTEHVTC